MISEPKLQYREELPYVAIRKTLAMEDIAKDLPPLIPKILAWVKENNVEQTGPLFFRYLSRDENNVMVADVGVPVADFVHPEGGVKGGSFPAGNYLTATHTGPYQELRASHIYMDGYARKQGLHESGGVGEKGEFEGTRAEFYITDPGEVKDESKWVTELMFLVEE